MHHILENTQQLSRTLEVDSRGPTKEEAQQHRLEQTRSEKIEEELQVIARDDEQLRNTTDFNHDLDDPVGSTDGAGFTAHRQKFNSNGQGTTSPSSFRRIFPDVKIESGGFESVSSFFRAADDAARGLGNDPRLLAVHTGGLSPAAGGFSVPTEFASQMLDEAIEETVFILKARIEPMKSDSRKVWAFETKTTTASPATLFGGLNPRWTVEAGSITSTDSQLRSINLEAKKLALFSQSSNELIADGLNFEKSLARAFRTSMAWALDHAALNGTGAGQPLGVLNDDALIAVAKEGGPSAATITYVNIVKIFARLHPALVQNSIWIANSATIPQLLQLSITIGDAGSHVPVLK